MSKYESKYSYTASLMDDALLILLETKDFEFITVKELCKKAGVNRSTFYLHYENMNDLLEETIEMINKRFYSSFKEIIDITDITTAPLTRRKYLKPYLEFIQNNKKAYKLIHNKSTLFNSNKAFIKMYNEIFNPALDFFKISEKEKTYILSFYINGTLSIINEWLKNECRDDIDFIIDLITKYTNGKIDEIN